MCEFKRDERNNQAEKCVPSSEGIAAVVWIAMGILRRCLLSSLLLSCEVVWAREVTRRCWAQIVLAHPKPTLGNRGLKEFSKLLTLSWNSTLENVASLAWERREDCSVTYPSFLFPSQANAWGHCPTELWNIQQDLFFSEEVLLCILAPHQIPIQLNTPLIPSSTHRIPLPRNRGIQRPILPSCFRYVQLLESWVKLSSPTWPWCQRAQSFLKCWIANIIVLHFSEANNCITCGEFPRSQYAGKITH